MLGIHRTIPVEYPGPDGTNYELFLAVTSVTDGSRRRTQVRLVNVSNGHARSENLYSRRGRCDAHGRDRLQRCATARDSSTSHDEFYWNVTGNDWPVPIEHAAATVRFPGISAAGSLRRPGVYRRVRFAGARRDFQSGRPGNWNIGLSVVNGRDKKSLPGRHPLPGLLKRQVAIMEDPANKGVVLVGCRRDIKTKTAGGL